MPGRWFVCFLVYVLYSGSPKSFIIASNDVKCLLYYYRDLFYS